MAVVELSGKLAVVTGAASGIGRALAERLATAGCDLALCDIDPDGLDLTATRCRDARPGSVVTTFALDVTDRAALDAFAAAVRKEHRVDHIDLLFNNAGIGGGESFVADPPEEWERTFDVSWGGLYRTTRAFFPLLQAAPSATIVNVGSINGTWATLGRGRPITAYAAAKFAVRGFTEALQHDLELHAPNVRAVHVVPAGVRTAISVNSHRLLGRDPMTMSGEQLAAERVRLAARGIDVTGLDDPKLRRMLARSHRAFDTSAHISADEAAVVVLAGLRAGRQRILVGPSAFMLDRLTRLLGTHIYSMPNRAVTALAFGAAPLASARLALATQRRTSATPDGDQTGSMTERRSVLITGASTGIGAAAALRLDELGWRVFAGVRRSADGERLRQSASERLRPVLVDVTDADQVRSALNEVTAELDGAGLDGLVNNAGTSFGGPLEIVPLDQWREQYEVNVIGQVAVTQAALPLLREAAGRVVFISSLSGRVAQAYMGPYASSKFAIEGLAMSLRKEMWPWGVRVAVIEPGVIDTPIWHKTPDLDEVEQTYGKEGLDVYRPYLEPLAGIVEKELAAAAPVSAATDAIVDALSAAHPKHRYLVGRDAKVLARLYRVLPDRVAARAEKVVWRIRLRD